jgi:hypothetical protein
MPKCPLNRIAARSTGETGKPVADVTRYENQRDENCLGPHTLLRDRGRNDDQDAERSHAELKLDRQD